MKAGKVLLLALATLILATIIFIFWFNTVYSDKFYPGIAIAGKEVGGKNYNEVVAYFKTKADALSKNGLRLTFEGERGKKEVWIPVAISGFSPDISVEYFVIGEWEKTVDSAYDWGRSGSWLRRFRELSVLIFGKNFEFSAAPRVGAVKSLLSRELKGFFQETVPAQFFVRGNSVTVLPEKIGEVMEFDRVVAVFAGKLARLDGSSETFESTKNSPPALKKDLESFLPLAKELAREANLVFEYRGNYWNVSGRRLVTWLTVKENGDLGVDDGKLSSFLARTVAPLIDDPPENSRFEMRNGSLVEVTPGRSGKIVDVPGTAGKVEKIIPEIGKAFALNGNLALALSAIAIAPDTSVVEGAIEIPVEVTEGQPIITQATLDAHSIKELVGSARTSFAGSSADRRHNIETGVAKLTGILIAPGEEFSAVSSIGTTSVEEGFLAEYVIKDNKSVKELGGGLCQIATTLFRAVLNTGLPVTERVNHSYVVSYYGPGLDATIYDPHPDLRFVNDTDNYLLLQGRVEGDEVVFEFYGRKDGRTVAISEPVLSDPKPAPDTQYVLTQDLPPGTVQCSETPRQGITTDVTYRVNYFNGKVNEQGFHSVYKPWGKICLMGFKAP